MEHLNNPETPRPVQIYEQIELLHEEFYSLVPQYNREIWSPSEAIKIHAGGCMSELLYVAGGLLYEGSVKEEDLSIRFSNDHGKRMKKGMVGGQVPDFRHVVLILNIDNKQHQCDFRLYRADEKPQFEEIPIDDVSYESDSLEFFTFADGLREYATRAGVQVEDVPSVADIVALHAPQTNFGDASQVRFDEDF
jgi:hypothetical protein